MADIFSKEKRSQVMSSVKHRGSKVEAQTASILRRMKIRYRSHPKGFVGNPDFYLLEFDTVVFADSCFWHGCRYHGTMPKSNKKFWQNKINRNKTRDREVNKVYKKQGRTVLRIWEHTLKSPKKEELLKKVLQVFE